MAHSLGSINEGRLGVKVEDVVVLGADQHRQKHTDVKRRNCAEGVILHLVVHKRCQKNDGEHQGAYVTESHPALVNPSLLIRRVIPAGICEKVSDDKQYITKLYVNFGSVK